MLASGVLYPCKSYTVNLREDFLDERAPGTKNNCAITSKKQTAPIPQGLESSPFTLDWTLLGLTGWRLKLNSTLLKFYLN